MLQTNDKTNRNLLSRFFWACALALPPLPHPPFRHLLQRRREAAIITWAGVGFLLLFGEGFGGAFAQGAAKLLSANEWNNKGTFCENKGQIVDQFLKPNKEVLFLLEQPFMKVYLTDKGFSYELYKCSNCPEEITHKFSKCDPSDDKFQFESYRVDIAFLNSNSGFVVEKSGELSEDINYNHTLHGTEPVVSKRYTKVVYRNIYEGIDIHFSTNNKGEFKYDLLLRDGADLSQIRYSFNGSEVKADKNGGILICTPLGDIHETIPLSYTTDTKGKKKDVDIKFKIRGKNTVSLSSLTDVSGRQLLIDPFPALQWATYYGSANIDMVNAVTSDMQGNIIAVGQTMSSNNIATTGSHQVTYTSDFDIFVVKFNKAGVRQWCTYYGGSNADYGYTICSDISGNIYVGGSTYSLNNISETGSWQPFFEGMDDAFLVKFNPAGVRLWATYYGGDNHDYIADMVVDNSGDLVLTGHSRSNYNISTPGTHQPVLAGLENIIISKFSPSGTLLWGTYLGAGEFDEGYGIDIDSNDNIYVGGHTQSASGISTNGTFQPSFQGVMDGFLVKFNTNGIRSWGTYFGGSAPDRIWDIALDANNNIFVVGETESVGSIATPGAFQTIKGSYDDSFLQKFNNNGERTWGTFIGGNSSDYLYGIKCIKSTGEVVLGGYTESDNNISTLSAFQTQRGGAFDAFVMKFNTNGNRNWGTYFGGTDTEEMKSLTLGDNNNIIIAGYTGSLSGIATQGSHQSAHGGHFYDGFIAKLCEPLKPVISYNDSVCVGNSLTLDAGNGFSSFLWNNGTAFQQQVSVPSAAGVYGYWVATIDTNNCAGQSDTVYIAILSAQAPVITQNGSVLTSSAGASYQWYLNGNSIPLATGQNYTMLESGSYMLSVTDSNGCSAESEPFLMTNIAFDSHQGILLYPNPADKELYVFFNNENADKEIIIFNAFGQSLYTARVINSRQHIIPINEFSAGMYYLYVSDKEISYAYKFVVQH